MSVLLGAHARLLTAVDVGMEMRHGPGAASGGLREALGAELDWHLRRLPEDALAADAPATSAAIADVTRARALLDEGDTIGAVEHARSAATALGEVIDARLPRIVADVDASLGRVSGDVYSRAEVGMVDLRRLVDTDVRPLADHGATSAAMRGDVDAELAWTALRSRADELGALADDGIRMGSHADRLSLLALRDIDGIRATLADLPIA